MIVETPNPATAAPRGNGYSPGESENLAQVANRFPPSSSVSIDGAAELLGVSRDYIVELLNSKQLPARTSAGPSEISYADLIAYKERDDAARNQIADELAAEAQAMGLGY